jgi:hypothetical protein
MRPDKVSEFAKRIEYLRSATGPRGRGNTDLILDGAKKYPKRFALISLSAKEAIRVSKLSGNENMKPQSIHILKPGELSAMPIIFDTSAIDHLLEETLDILEGVIDRKEAREVTDSLMKCCEDYQDRCHKVERLIMDIRVTKWWEFKKRNKLNKKLYEMIDNNISHSPIEYLFFKTSKKYDAFYKFGFGRKREY